MRDTTKLSVVRENIPTTNYDTTRKPIKYIVIHTMVGTLSGTSATFKNASYIRSAHYGVGLSGEIRQWVSEQHTAFHATNYAVNQASIGIEHEDGYNPSSNKDAPFKPRPDALYESSIKLVADICRYYQIPIDRKHILKHNEIDDPRPQYEKVPTQCPGTLDIDRIVEGARNLIEGELSTPTVINKPALTVSDDEMRAINLLKDKLNTYVSRTGSSFGSLENMAREMLSFYPEFLRMTMPDMSGRVPVYISASQFNEYEKAWKVVDELVDYFGYNEGEFDDNFSDKVIGRIEELESREPRVIEVPIEKVVVKEIIKEVPVYKNMGEIDYIFQKHPLANDQQVKLNSIWQKIRKIAFMDLGEAIKWILRK